MEASWTARILRPIVAAGVAAVFLAFMAIAWFVFHSGDALRALAATGAGALVALVPGLLARVEYRVDDTGVSRRAVRKRATKEFETLFTWDELDRLVPTRTGYTFYKHVDGSSPIRRFIKRHVMSGYSGRIHVDDGDRSRVRGLLEQRRQAPSLP